MARLLVVCITKKDHEDPWERITHIGGPEFGVIASEEAIRRIEAGTDTFFTMVNGKEAELEVHERFGKKYLKTHNDHDAPDNLLSLNDCKPTPPPVKKGPHRYAR